MELGLDIFYGMENKAYRRKFDSKLASEYRSQGRSFKELYRIVRVVDNVEELTEKQMEEAGTDILLDRGRKYYIGVDASLTQTGLSIFDDSLRLIAMVDIINSDLNETEFKAHFGCFLRANFQDSVFAKSISERELTFKHGKVAAQLSELQKYILETLVDLGFEVDNIQPTVWRKWVLANPKYTGRKTGPAVKIAVMEEVLERFPKFDMYTGAMKAYSKASQARVCDSCDAVGVLLGYMAECYVDSNIKFPRVNYTKDKDAIHKKIISYEVLQNGKIYETAMTGGYEAVRTIGEKFASEIQQRGATVMFMNPKMSIEENMQRVTSVTNKVVVLKPTQGKEVTALQWESGRTLIPGQEIVIVCFNKNRTAKPLSDLLANMPVM